MSRRISSVGKQLIQSFEGLHEVGGDGLVHSYKCPAGVWTIGFGNTRGVVEGLTITPSLAGQLFEHELSEFEEGVDRLIEGPVSQRCFDAYVSLAYNIGLGNLAESTTLRELNLYLKTKDQEHLLKAWDSFLWWNKAGGKVLKGLVRRREAELKHWRQQ